MPFQKRLGKPNGHPGVQETASTAWNQSKSTTATLGHQAEDAAHRVGSSLKSWAQDVRTQGPQEGILGSAAESLANTMDTSGNYLQRNTLKAMANDVTNLIRDNPWPAMMVGLGLGFLLARSIKRS